MPRKIRHQIEIPQPIWDLVMRQSATHELTPEQFVLSVITAYVSKIGDAPTIKPLPKDQTQEAPSVNAETGTNPKAKRW